MTSIDEASAEKIFNKVLDCWRLKLSRIVVCSSHYQFTAVKKDDKLHNIYLIVDDGFEVRWIKSCRSLNEIYSGFIDDLININSKVWKHSVACFEWRNVPESWQSQKRVQLCKSGDALPEELCVMLDLATAK